MIDKQQVIDGLECCSGRVSCISCPYNGIDDCIDVLKRHALELLKSQPEQKHGHWISYGCGFYRCSVCEDAKNMNFVPNYCSTCGAKMDEEVKQE